MEKNRHSYSHTFSAFSCTHFTRNIRFNTNNIFSNKKHLHINEPVNTGNSNGRYFLRTKKKPAIHRHFANARTHKSPRKLAFYTQYCKNCVTWKLVFFFFITIYRHQLLFHFTIYDVKRFFSNQGRKWSLCSKFHSILRQLFLSLVR